MADLVAALCSSVLWVTVRRLLSLLGLFNHVTCFFFLWPFHTVFRASPFYPEGSSPFKRALSWWAAPVLVGCPWIVSGSFPLSSATSRETHPIAVRQPGSKDLPTYATREGPDSFSCSRMQKKKKKKTWELCARFSVSYFSSQGRLRGPSSHLGPFPWLLVLGHLTPPLCLISWP